jgi:peptide chain release factor subunit 1
MSITTEPGSRIRAVAEVWTDEPLVISLYFNLDPSTFGVPKERNAEIASLTDDARAQLASAGLSHDATAELDSDIERIRRFLEEELDASGGVQGVVIFCCSRLKLFEVFKLSTSVEPSVLVGRTANIEQLASNLPTTSWCVFLVNRRTSRILRGTDAKLVQVAETEDDVHRQHDQGGWSQARFQRSVEEEVQNHLESACNQLFDSFQRVPFEKLLVGCPEELWPEVRAKLHRYVSDLVVARFDAEVEHENHAEILERAHPLMEQERARDESALLDRFAEQYGRGERAASGPTPVLEALNQARVDVLFLADGYSTAGVFCPNCSFVAVQGRECPVDGARLELTEDVIEPAVRVAVLQSAAVHRVRYHEPERALGASIAALLRF